MKTLLLCLIALLAAMPASRSANPDQSPAIRQRFVPEKKTGEPRKGASWSALSKAPMVKPGELFAQASAGIGDKFPLQQAGRTLFEVAVTGGDDDHLLVEVRAENSTQKFELRRDKRTSVQVDGVKFELLYPSLEVDRASGAATTDLATIFITRLP
jgi:hypothetical protein